MTIKSKTISKKGMIINVEPLRTIEEVNEFRGALQYASSAPYVKRNLLLFNIGINTGLRIGDIVKLRIEDVRGKSSIIIWEGKTEKKRTVFLDSNMVEIADYIESIDNQSTEWLFPSRKGDNHISTTQAYRILDKAAKSIGRDDIGTHTLRKTFGYHYYQLTKDVASLMEILNHDSQSTTRKYIGITDDEVRANIRGLGL